MNRIILLFFLGLTYTNGIGQSYYYKNIDIHEPGTIYQIIPFGEKIFLSSQLLCVNTQKICTNIAEINDSGNILNSIYFENINPSISTFIYRDLIYLGGLDSSGGSTVILEKRELSGNVLQNKKYNFIRDGEYMNIGYMAQWGDNFILTGQLVKDNKSVGIIAKFDLDLNLISTHIDPSNDSNVTWDIAIGPDSLLTCFIMENGFAEPRDRRRIEKYDKDLNLVWKYQPPDSLLYLGNDVKLYGTVLNNGNIFFTYYKMGWNDRLPQFLCLDTLIKKSVWEYDFLNINSHKRLVLQTKELKNGDILISGSYATLATTPRIRNSPWLMRLDRNGNRKWERAFVELGPDGQDKTGTLWDFIELDNGDLMACGHVTDINNRWDPLLIRTDADGCIDQGQTNCPQVQIIDLMSGAVDVIGEDVMTISPNPGYDVLNIELPYQAQLPLDIDIIDIHGHKIHTAHHDEFETVTIDALSWASGIYAIHLRDRDGRRWAGKWVRL